MICSKSSDKDQTDYKQKWRYCALNWTVGGKNIFSSNARKFECLKNDWSSWKVVNSEASCCVQDDEEYLKITAKPGLLQQPNNQDYTGSASPSHVTMTSHKLTLFLSVSLLLWCSLFCCFFLSSPYLSPLPVALPVSHLFAFFFPFVWLRSLRLGQSVVKTGCEPV